MVFSSPEGLESSAYGDELDRKYVGKSVGLILHIWQSPYLEAAATHHLSTALSASLVRVQTCVVV